MASIINKLKVHEKLRLDVLLFLLTILLTVSLPTDAAPSKARTVIDLLEVVTVLVRVDQIRSRETYWKKVLCSKEFDYNKN